jgi:hypothetical protein
LCIWMRSIDWYLNWPYWTFISWDMPDWQVLCVMWVGFFFKKKIVAHLPRQKKIEIIIPLIERCKSNKKITPFETPIYIALQIASNIKMVFNMLFCFVFTLLNNLLVIIIIKPIQDDWYPIARFCDHETRRETRTQKNKA